MISFLIFLCFDLFNYYYFCMICDICIVYYFDFFQLFDCLNVNVYGSFILFCYCKIDVKLQLDFVYLGVSLSFCY